MSIFGSLDAPVDLVEEGMEYLKSNLTYEEKQKHRDRLFKVDKDRIVKVASKYFDFNHSSTTIIGEKVDDESKLFGWDVRIMNLE